MKQIYPTVIGLGYVGLPLFLRLIKKFKCTGFDINSQRILQLKKGIDQNKEFTKKDLILTNGSTFSNKLKKSSFNRFFIITVPTPVLTNKKPDLRPLTVACENLKKVIKDGDIIFFESTVYPGLTRSLKQKYFKNKKIYLGYSPERINPGDKKNTINNINKIVSFDDYPNNIKKIIIDVYKTITPNIVLSKSIENAEMSKVIENIQRDINIAFMNEIFMVCKKLDLNFMEIIKLAKTKWNFLNFSPGLVGGHCLPVDPFYLYHLAKKNNYNAKFMLSGRQVNDELGKFIVNEIIKNFKHKKYKKILILGVSYKSNVADLRNSLALKIYLKLKKQLRNRVFAFDPIVDKSNARKFKILQKISKINNYDLIVPLVNHNKFQIKFESDYILKKNRYLDFFNYFKK